MTTLDFTTGSLPAGVTYSGGTNGTRVNSSGVLVAASGARFDYDPATLAPLGILCEPARTNYATYSENIGGASWDNIGLSSQTLNNATAPDGTVTADTIGLTNGSLGEAREYQLGWVSGQNGALSIYAKSATTSAALRLTTNNISAWGTGVSSRASLSPTWSRPSLVGVLEVGSSSVHGMFGNFDATGTVDNTIPTETVALWGAQLEVIGTGERAEASTYIPATAGSAVTRAADQISFTIPAGVSSLVYTFDDASTQTVAVTAGSYIVPTNLSRARIKTIDLISSVVPGDLRVSEQSAYVPMVQPGVILTEQSVYVALLPATNTRRRQVMHGSF